MLLSGDQNFKHPYLKNWLIKLKFFSFCLEFCKK